MSYEYFNDNDHEDDDDRDEYDGEDDFDERNEDDEFDEAVMNCSKGRDGLCGQAGSEYCDWECPFNR